LRTADAASPVAAEAIASSLVAFLIVYLSLFAGFLYFAARQVLQGPPADAVAPMRSLALPDIAPVPAPAE